MRCYGIPSNNEMRKAMWDIIDFCQKYLKIDYLDALDKNPHDLAYKLRWKVKELERVYCVKE